MAPYKQPFQLLEINLISAQDLAPVSKSLQTYAVVWVHPQRKLTTRADPQGKNNPTWNEKFIFRVDDEFLDSVTSAVMIEIYNVAWLRDVRVGMVRVLISNLIPPSARSSDISNMRFVALQIRRPSGRPQGILNMGVTLLDSTMRSMPLYTELSASAVGYRDLIEGKADRQNNHQHQKPTLRRTQSEKTDNTKKSTCPAKSGSVLTSSVCNGTSICNGSSMVNGSEVNGPAKSGIGNGGSIISDVGPSPSVVAAAIAKGIYPINYPVPKDDGSSILEDWTLETASVEGLKAKIERWRAEFPSIQDKEENFEKLKYGGNRHGRRHTVGGEGGLFRCFGNAYGCEFTIVCGANSQKKKKKKFSSANRRRIHLSPSEDDYSQSYL